MYYCSLTYISPILPESFNIGNKVPKGVEVEAIAKQLRIVYSHSTTLIPD